MVRVVIDTNVIVSALLQPLGPPARILVLVIRGSIRLCISADIYFEYEEVINRPRFRIEATAIVAALYAIRTQSLWFTSVEPLRVCSDPDDNIFLECAEAAGAKYLVTGNLKHFPLSWNDIQIVTPRQFLDIESINPGSPR